MTTNSTNHVLSSQQIMSQFGNETMHYPNPHHTTTGKLQLPLPPSPP